MAYTKYSLTPANNTAAPPDGAPEGMLPSAVNDTMRDMMAQIRDVGDGIRGGTYTMTAAVITGGTITGATVTSNTFSSSGATITGGTINSTAIGGTTAAAGKFTTLEATGVTTVQAGTVSLPAITTTGDTNTGIFFPAADTIAFTEGGTEAMRINSSGNVTMTGSLTTSQTGGIVGSTTNNNANAGAIGETIVSTASGINLTNAASNGTSISLTAGDWDVAIYASGAGASATCTAIRIGISETSATFGTQGLDWLYGFADPVNGPTGGSLPLRRISLASTTTIYGVLATTAGTNGSLNCTLIARRRR